MTKVLLLHNTLVLDMTIIKETRDLSALHIDPHRNHKSPYRCDSRRRYRSRSYSKEHNFIHSHPLLDHLLDPGDSRFSRSRSHSNTKNKLNTIQSQTQNDPINSEVHMYHSTEKANAVTPISWFYSLYTHTSLSETQCDFPLRLEISFLLDSGASISELNYPTYVTNAKLLKIEQINTLNSSKISIHANQTENSILHYVTITLNTTLERNSGQFIIPFAVADKNTISVVHPALKNKNFQHVILQFKHQSTVHPSYTKVTSLLTKDYSSFLYI